MNLPLLLTDDEHVPLYMQLVHQVRYLITARQLTEGDRLPSVRELATQLGVNSGTVALAYRTLQQERLIESRRGTGTFVSGQADVTQRFSARLELLNRYADDFIRLGFALGCDAAALRQAVASRLTQPRVVPVVLALRGQRTAMKYMPQVVASLPDSVIPDVRPADLATLYQDGPEREALFDGAYYVVTFQSSVPSLGSALGDAGIRCEIIGVTARLTEGARWRLRDLDPAAPTCLVTESWNVSSALALVEQNSALDVRSLPVITEHSSAGEIEALSGATFIHTFGVLDLLDHHAVSTDQRVELAFTLSEESRAKLRSLLDPFAVTSAAH